MIHNVLADPANKKNANKKTCRNPSKEVLKGEKMRIRTIILAALVVALMALTACGTKDKTEEASKVILEGNGAEFFKVSEDNFVIEDVIGLLVTVKVEKVQAIEGETEWLLTLKDAEGNVVEGAENIAINDFGKQNVVNMLQGELNVPAELKFNIEVDDEAANVIKEKAVQAVVTVNVAQAEVVEEDEVLPEEDAKKTEAKPVAKPTPPAQKPVEPDRPQKPAPTVPSSDIDGKLTQYENAVDKYMRAKDSAKPGDPKAVARIEKEKSAAVSIGNELAAKMSEMSSAQKTKYNNLKAKLN